VLGGDFNELLLCEWGSPLSIEVDPYTLGASGGVRIVAMADVDVIVRHPEAFVVGSPPENS